VVQSGAKLADQDTGGFNGDGKSDILWHNDDATPVIRRMKARPGCPNSVADPFNPGQAGRSGYRRLQW
jgi:hypothetical protein